MPPHLSPGFPAGLAQGLSGCHTEKAPASSSCPSKTPRLPSLPPSPPPFLSASGSAALRGSAFGLHTFSFSPCISVVVSLGHPSPPLGTSLSPPPPSQHTRAHRQTVTCKVTRTDPCPPALQALQQRWWCGLALGGGSGRGPHGISLCPYPWRHFLAQPKRRPRPGWSGILGFGGLAAAFSETVGQGISL